MADFRDLHVDPVRRDVWWPRLQREWGKRIVAPADELWTVSQGQAAQLVGFHPNIKVHRSQLKSLPPSSTSPHSNNFDIVYTGSLYEGLQTIEPLLSVLSTIPTEGIRLIYRGKDQQLWRQWMQACPPGVQHDSGPLVPSETITKIQQEAQVLLLLTWSAPNYYGILTAKLFDYLATGRPILALVNGPDDPELREIVEGGAAGRVFPDGQQGTLREWLLTCYAAWREDNALPWRVNTSFLEKYL